MRIAFVAAAALLAAGFARADGPQMPRAVPPAYTQECGSCHVAYPPGMLPARSWQRIVAGLENHYGSDASLEPPVVQALGHVRAIRDNGTVEAQPAAGSIRMIGICCSGAAVERLADWLLTNLSWF